MVDCSQVAAAASEVDLVDRMLVAVQHTKEQADTAADHKVAEVAGCC